MKVFSNPGVGCASVVLGKMRASRMRERCGGSRNRRNENNVGGDVVCVLGQRVKLREKAKGKARGMCATRSRGAFRIFHAISAPRHEMRSTGFAVLLLLGGMGGKQNNHVL